MKLREIKDCSTCSIPIDICSNKMKGNLPNEYVSDPYCTN